MKRLLVLLGFVTLVTTSSFAFTAFRTLYNGTPGSKGESYYYNPNSRALAIQLLALRCIAPTGEQACYASVSGYVGGRTMIFYESASSQYKGKPGFLSKSINAGTTNFELRIFLYCPEMGDYAQARVVW